MELNQAGKSEPSNVPHAVVIGAGVCGLYGALTFARAGWQVTVIEKEDFVGGLAASQVVDGNPHDFGVHMLHGFDKPLLEDLLGLMGDRSHSVRLNAEIRWRNRSFHYPLRFTDLIATLSPKELVYGVAGLVLAGVRSRFGDEAEALNAEEALIELYGDPLYELFFESFTHRYWGIHPRELSATFVKRKMPRLSAIDAIRQLLRRCGIKVAEPAVESALAEEILYYSSRGAGALPQAIAAEVERLGGRVLTGRSLSRILHKGGVIQEILFARQSEASAESEGGGEDGYADSVVPDVVLSTMPLGHLPRYFDPEPCAGVIEAARRLRHRPMAVFGVLVDRQQCSGSLYTYYRDRIFHRIGEPKNAGLVVTPEDASLLIIEVMCERGDAIWRGEDTAWDEVIRQTVEEGWLKPEQILRRHHMCYDSAYPVFLLGFEPHLENIQNWLSEFISLRSTGRQGGFCYPNMHQAMRAGGDSAQELIDQYQRPNQEPSRLAGEI